MSSGDRLAALAVTLFAAVVTLVFILGFAYGDSQGERKLRKANLDSYSQSHKQDAKSYQLCLEADAGSNCQAILGKGHN